jgi:drug/metabolite transporter (DMT)-like permease
MAHDGAVSDVPLPAVAPATNAVQRPSSADVGLLALGVAAISTSAPLIAATVAPAMAIAFWRNALGAAVIAPFAWWRHRDHLRSLSRREWGLAAAAGGLLAGHFATWVPSLDFTTVASSTALLAFQPAFTALIERARGQYVARAVWGGIAVAFVGVLVITGVDFTLSPRALFGDLLSLVGTFLAACYVMVGSRARRTMSTSVYTTIVYAVAAVVLLLVCLIGRQPVSGFSTDTWVKLIALTLGAQVVGHTSLNAALRRTSPTVVSLAILFEMPGAALIAAVWLGQVPPVGVLAGAGLLLAGTGIVLVRGTRAPR